MAKTNSLFFYHGTSKSAMYPASAFLGVDAVTDTTTLKLMFKSMNGFASDDVVTLGFTGTHKDACKALAEALTANKGLTTIADADKGVYLHPFNAIDDIVKGSA